MKDLSDYKEKAAIGKAACVRSIKKYNEIISACKLLSIDVDPEILNSLKEAKEGLRKINELEAKIDAKCN